ncbi:MAG: A/G-specific adenine glycosylase [Porphyromonadaceae bacterium]|nr:MAG: A/G-specific adenine glycosylase [Porphyromonadaceae bacterium]
MDLASLLLTWYDQNGRSLPWRGSRDPYIIWVSEIIFQQTRIEQGTGYFLRFADRFPTLDSLAGGEEDEVLRLWQGLGYYSRARNLLFTARYIHEHLGGKFPEDFDSMKKLKGIGDYTASCIASICFRQTHAAVDGNVYRVLSRLFADSMSIDTQAGKLHFKKLAQQLISRDRPGDFNEALMDLGATVCKPRSPSCSICPVNSWCQANEKKIQMKFPVKAPTREKSGSVINYLLINAENHIVINKRSGKGIWKGLYELPMIPGELAPVDLAAECLELYGLKVNSLTEIRRVKHLLTHTELDIRFYSAQTNAVNNRTDNNLLSVPIGKIEQYPFAKPLVDFLSSLQEK